MSLDSLRLTKRRVVAGLLGGALAAAAAVSVLMKSSFADEARGVAEASAAFAPVLSIVVEQFGIVRGQTCPEAAPEPGDACDPETGEAYCEYPDEDRGSVVYECDSSGAWRLDPCCDE